MNDFIEQLSDVVRAARKANHLSQTELAQMAGVGRRFLAELEAGKTSLQLDKVNDVLHVFGRRLGIVAEARGMPDDAEQDSGGR